MLSPFREGVCRYTTELVALLDRTGSLLGLINGSTHVRNDRADGAFATSPGTSWSTTGPAGLGRPLGYVPHRWTDTDPAAYRTRAVARVHELRTAPTAGRGGDRRETLGLGATAGLPSASR